MLRARRYRPSCAKPALWAAVSAFLAISSASWAGPGEQSLSLTSGFATFSVPDLRAYGGALGIDYEYRVTDAVAVRGSGSGGVYDADGTAYSGQAVLGLTYAFDVIKYVPYANAGIGAIVLTGDAFETDVNPLVEVGVGVDVLHSRTFSYGVVARFETLLEKTSYFTAATRLSWRWGFF